ncbi:OB-fold putative lipoprotein [Breznakiella homolactica]|uniref:Lipoprotein n=1 Tax=Breznakiella homolactica TaxID=2798577 RepID=A0A7T7XJL6_9SPIR|nr:OB-fold putative lipoprotein [Breznakiella homolactica]QQO07620.1 OB-fold putative lipoprotein [Breznakiella homolactica]
MPHDYEKQGKKRSYMKKWVVAFISVFLLLSCDNKNREVIHTDPYSLTAEFVNNSDAASQKYKNKLIEITGIIAERGFPKDHKPLRDASYIVFSDSLDENGQYDFNKPHILCYFDDIEVHETAVNGKTIPLRNGYTIILQGQFSEYIPEWNRIQLRHSKILDVLASE